MFSHLLKVVENERDASDDHPLKLLGHDLVHQHPHRLLVHLFRLQHVRIVTHITQKEPARHLHFLQQLAGVSRDLTHSVPEVVVVKFHNIFQLHFMLPMLEL